MYRVYLDTSYNKLTVLITENDVVLASYSENALQKQTELTLKVINKLLEESKLNLQKIDEVVVTTGPGSYTGVRIGITFAKTLKVLNPKLQIYSVNALFLQAGLDKAISIFQAHNNKSYIAVFDTGNVIIPSQLVSQEAKLGIIKDLGDYKVIQNFESVNVQNNFLLLKNYLMKIDNLNELKPLYIGDNFSNTSPLSKQN